MVDKVVAHKLRNSGLTYREISCILMCSIGWCKCNLKGVESSGEPLTQEELLGISETVRNTPQTLAYGVGLYSEGFYSAKVDNEHTKEYKLWRAMLRRCYKTSEGTSYEDCEVSDEFLHFQSFAKWCNEQVGFDLEDYQLDKDILIEGNKIYSAETCVFVPKDLNCFNRVNEGKYKQGVCWHEGTQKYRSRIQDVVTGKRICLGLYATEQSAFDSYVIAKNKQARLWLQKLTSGEFIVDQKVIERMSTWTCPV